MNEIWQGLSKTNPDYTKKFNRPGGFQGTDINPQYRWQKLTEMFGPAGIGWGTCEEHIWTQPMEDGQVMVFVRLRLWFVDPNSDIGRTPLGCGGDFIIKKTKQGLMPDDEGFKKAYTDAVGNAARFLGLGADVYMGLFDDSKYVNQRRAEETQANGNGRADTAPDIQPVLDEIAAATDGDGLQAVKDKMVKPLWPSLAQGQKQKITQAAKARQQALGLAD